MLFEYRKENTTKELARVTDELRRKQKESKSLDSLTRTKQEELKQFDSIGFTKEEVRKMMKDEKFNFIIRPSRTNRQQR